MSARATEEDGENHIRAYGVEPSAFNGRDQFVRMVYEWFTEKRWFMAPVCFAIGGSKMLLKLFCMLPLTLIEVSNIRKISDTLASAFSLDVVFALYFTLNQTKWENNLQTSFLLADEI